ncbi:dehydrogenase [Bacillus pseudomycoides]|nr:dehydrogenase [Bacillus pseudomycoides]PEI88225.1 dehydrogenase [Bacillus pseudomycoides]PEK62761.1 dehydrogenase [Bacillus pseudomycoides]PEL20720.1 dehydrogenase [Bacillus pseudomycoides]PGA87659.1 dehydrogenase [Bacillus pseudomycoides]
MEGNMSEQIYYWSPIKHWEKLHNEVLIGETKFPGVLSDWFPELYFLTQKGVTISELVERFSLGNKEETQKIVELMIKNRVLVSNILHPREVFSTQEKIFPNPYSNQIHFSKEELDKYISEQLNRTHPAARSTGIQLKKTNELPAIIKERRSCRQFDMNKPISFSEFSKFISTLKQVKEEKIYYHYASAGGLYPIDIFVYIKPKRIEGMKAGFYYYSPSENSLLIVNNIDQVIKSDHELINQELFNQSAFSVYLVYNANASIPKYGSDGYLFACIESGIITATLNMVAETLNLGVCSVGHMKFEEIQHFLSLDNHQVFLHGLEVGLKINE